MHKYFEFEKLGTSYKQEIIAGITTFFTMSYIIVVNPAILEAAGIPKGPSMVATILSAFFGTLIMGVYAKRPFAIAPYMGENAFIAYTVVKVLGYSWQTAIGAIFIGGVLFMILTLAKIRSWLAEAIPETLKYSFAAGIGLFLTFIGLNDTGIIRIGLPEQPPPQFNIDVNIKVETAYNAFIDSLRGTAPVKLGALGEPAVLLAILGFMIIGFLMIKKVRGAILIGIFSITILSYIFGVTTIPHQWVSLPPDISPIFLKLDIAGAFTWGFFAVILTVLMLDFVDTMGTLLGVSARAGLLDEKGNLPEIEKPMLADALATVVGALLGTTTAGTYLESAAGIEEGGKTGFTSIITSFLFLLALFFAPFLTSIPAHAYGPALIIVGMLMLSPITKINFTDYTELIPSFITIILMSFTFNMGIGITAGLVLYPLLKILTGKGREIHPGLWILGILSLLFYIFYPYH